MFNSLQKLFSQAATVVPGFMTLVYSRNRYSIFHSCSDLTGRVLGDTKFLVSIPCRPLWSAEEQKQEIVKALGQRSASDYFTWAIGEECPATIENMQPYNAVLHRKMIKHYEAQLKNLAYAWAEDIYVDVISGELVGQLEVKLCSS